MDKAWEWVKFIIKCMLLIFTALMSFCIVVSMTVVPAEEGWPLNELPIWFAIFGAMAVGFGFGCWKIFLSIRGDIPALFERSSFSSKSAAQKSTDEEKKKWWHGAPDYVFGNSASVDKKHVNLKDYHDFLSHHNKLFTVAHFRNTAGTKEWGTDLYVDKIVGWSTYLVTTFADGMPVDLNEQTLQSSAPAETVELSIQKISRAQMRALLEKAVQVSPTKKSLQLALQNHASFEGRIGLKEGFEFASQCKNMVFLEGEHIRDEWERVTEVYQQKSTGQLYLMSHNGMRVAICDDVQQDREVLFACLTSIFAELQVEAEIISFSSGTELIQNYPNDLDFLVLDIQMNEMDGIETARKIREFDASLCIEFLTNMPQFARDCYKVRAFGYLLKPVSYEELRLEIMEALALNKIQNSKYLVVKNRDVKKRIAVTDIIYVEYIDHKLKIVTVDSEEHMYGALTDLEKTLNGVPFIRPHAAFIVNMKYVLSVSRDTIMMMNQAVIPLSRNRKREIFAKWESFAK